MTNEPERIIRLEDTSIGLDGYIVLDTTRLGPSFGGIRITSYTTPDACLADARRLAAAMTKKCLFHEVPGGGGKATVNRDAIKDRRAVLARIGDTVESLGGAFFTGPDTGTGLEDLRIVAERTSRVTLADVSDSTAFGLEQAIRAVLDSDGRSLADTAIVFQGLGAVGARAAAALSTAGVEVSGADLDAGRCAASAENGVTIVDAQSVLDVECDVLSPCALGGVVDPAVAERLRCDMLVGAANNILTHDGVAEVLHGRGILFVPDFVANGGGLIHGAFEHIRGTGGSRDEVARIYERTRRLLEEAAARDVSPLRFVRAELESRRAALLGAGG